MRSIFICGASSVELRREEIAVAGADRPPVEPAGLADDPEARELEDRLELGPGVDAHRLLEVRDLLASGIRDPHRLPDAALRNRAVATHAQPLALELAARDEAPLEVVAIG